MSQNLRRVSLLSLMAAVALGATACGSSSSSTHHHHGRIDGEHRHDRRGTRVGAHRRNEHLGHRLPGRSADPRKERRDDRPDSPGDREEVPDLPVSGGQVAVATLAGTIQHTGGLKFTRAGKSVEMTSFIVDTSSKQVTALVDGQRIPILDLSLSSVKRASSPTAHSWRATSRSR